MGWVVNATPRPIYPRKDPVPIVYEAGWAPGPVWTGEEKPPAQGFDLGHAVAQLVEALRYKPKGRGLDSRWCH